MSFIPIYTYYDLAIQLDSERSSIGEVLIVGRHNGLEAIIAIQVANGNLKKIRSKNNIEFTLNDYELFKELINILKSHIIEKWQRLSLRRDIITETQFDMVSRVFEETPNFSDYKLIFNLLRVFCKSNYLKQQILLFVQIQSLLKSREEPKKSKRAKLKSFRQFFIQNPDLWETNEDLKELIGSDFLFMA